MPFEMDASNGVAADVVETGTITFFSAVEGRAAAVTPDKLPAGLALPSLDAPDVCPGTVGVPEDELTTAAATVGTAPVELGVPVEAGCRAGELRGAPVEGGP